MRALIRFSLWMIPLHVMMGGIAIYREEASLCNDWVILAGSAGGALLFILIGPAFFTQKAITFYDMISGTRVNFKNEMIENKWKRSIIPCAMVLACIELIKFLGSFLK